MWDVKCGSRARVKFPEELVKDISWFLILPFIVCLNCLAIKRELISLTNKYRNCYSYFDVSVDMELLVSRLEVVTAKLEQIALNKPSSETFSSPCTGFSCK